MNEKAHVQRHCTAEGSGGSGAMPARWPWRTRRFSLSADGFLEYAIVVSAAQRAAAVGLPSSLQRCWARYTANALSSLQRSSCTLHQQRSGGAAPHRPLGPTAAAPAGCRCCTSHTVPLPAHQPWPLRAASSSSWTCHLMCWWPSSPGCPSTSACSCRACAGGSTSACAAFRCDCTAALRFQDSLLRRADAPTATNNSTSTTVQTSPPTCDRRLRQLCAGPSQLWRCVDVRRRLESGPEETKVQLVGRSMQLQRGLGE